MVDVQNKMERAITTVLTALAAGLLAWVGSTLVSASNQQATIAATISGLTVQLAEIKSTLQRINELDGNLRVLDSRVDRLEQDYREDRRRIQ